MTYGAWWAARRLLYEEHIGIYERAQDNERSADYKRSTDLLKRQ